MENTPKKQYPAFAVLGVIALVAALLLSLTNALTEGPIEAHQKAALEAAYGAVMPLPEGGSYEQITDGLQSYDISSLYAAKDAQGATIGWCVTASHKGYGGPVAVTLGVDQNGLVTGCVVGDTSFAESAGIGTRAQEQSFRDQFIGLDAVNGGSFEKLSGATVTSTAVLEATNKALRCVSEVALGRAVTQTPLISFGVKAAPQVDTSALVPSSTMKGSAEGYGGEPVNVTVKLDENCAIASIKVDASTQTPGLGQRCQEDEAFLSQFVGQSLPVKVEALSGATITSEAVADAINGAQIAEDEAEEAASVAAVLAEDDNATVGLFDDGSVTVETESGFTGKVTLELDVVDGKVQTGTLASAQPESEPLPEGAMEAHAEGFGGDVYVTLALNEDGTISAMGVDASTETAGIGSKCADAEFINQFIGKTGPFTLGENVDTVTGATYTSQAVVDAVNSLLTAPAADEAPAADQPAALEGSAPGFNDDPVSVVVTLNEDGTIATLTVDASNQMAGIGKVCEGEEFTSQFIGKSGPFTAGENINVCSGATFTSQGVVNAVNGVLSIPADEPAAQPAALEGSAPGFNDDPVSVVVTLNEDGTIATLTVDASNQMAGIGKVCEGEEFTSQFIGKSGPFTAGENINVCSGATFTSQGVVNAVNGVLSIPADEPAADQPAALEGSAPGFNDDPVSVVVTLNEDGTIATLTVDASNQMAGIGKVCEGEEFIRQFIGKSGPFTVGENIEVCSGATFTSEGVVNAVNGVLSK